MKKRLQNSNLVILRLEGIHTNYMEINSKLSDMLNHLLVAVTREDAASRAADFLLRSRSAETMSWMPREAAAAFLALTANRPGEW